MDAEITKLAIIQSVVNMMADWNPEFMSGIETQLVLKDDSAFRIVVEKKTDDDPNGGE